MNQIRLSWKERSCQNITNDGGFATIWYLVAIVVILFLASFVTSEGYGNIQQSRIKTSMDRAVKAAVLQYNKEDLQNKAKITFNKTDAINKFRKILRSNLELDHALQPNEDSILSEALKVNIVFRHFYDDDTTRFPKTVNNEQLKLKHTFQHPGMAAVLKVKLPELWGTGTTTYYIPAVAEMKLKITGGE